MKKSIVLLINILLTVAAWAGLHSYTNQSILHKGKFVKISVAETGVHMLPYDTLIAWGLQPENVSIWGYGGAMLSENFTQPRWDDLPPIPCYMYKGTDNTFNSGDYILFYAQGTTSWQADINGIWRHTQNPYSDLGYYFLTDEPSLQHFIDWNTEETNSVNVKDVDWYTAYRVYEKDEINLIDPTSHVAGGGREFYSDMMNTQNSNKTISFELEDVITSQRANCKVDVAAVSGDVTSVKVTYADIEKTINISKISVSDYHNKAVIGYTEINTAPTSTGPQTIDIRMKSAASGAMTYINYVELNVPCSLVMRNNQLAISNTAYLNTGPLRFCMAGANNNTQVWRVTNGVDICQMVTSYNGGQLTWLDNNTRAEKYMAVDVSSQKWPCPKHVGTISNQNLHALENIDYVIICPQEFLEPAKRLAEKHEEIDHLTWAVVTDEQVYNEFSSGTPDATAYRWLMKMLYDRAENNELQRPKNLLLMGNGTFDNRKRLKDSGVRQLLTYQAVNSTTETLAYGTDDYFGFLRDNAGIHEGVFQDVRAKMEIGVGRLPVKTLAEANSVVEKICTYMDDKVLGKWKSQILFLADDGDHGLHVQTADGGAERLRKNNPDFHVTKIYLDAHTQEVSAGGESYPLAKNQFDNLMRNGVLFMNYSGHGSYNNITNELFMKSSDILNMSNTNLGFWFLATCSFSHYDGGMISAGELAILNPNGGAIGVLSASRTVYATQNTVLNRNLCDTLFGHRNEFEYNMTLGEAIRIAKNNTGYDVNKLPYVLLGDPAIKLNYPTDLQVKTILEVDTMHALTQQTVKGYIQTPNRDTATWFNGKLDITILDKMQQITTRDNDENKEDDKEKITYNDYPNMLFSGQTDVIDGCFEFQFMVPKDIRYNYGKGRIVYYAADMDTREEAVGHYEDFVIGGSSSVLKTDTTGPQLNIYLNTPAFQDGDDTYEFPHFYADIEDENGINTVGTGIGHDLLLVIDADPKQTFILNNYFQASNNSYQAGQVSYKMMEQSEGPHTLTFRAWDMYNNSSMASLSFHVVKGMDPNIYSVTTYPNPVASTGIMNVAIDYDQPDEIIETTVYLYNINGQLVHEHKQKGTDGITWNMSQIASNPGIYVYQVKIKTATSNHVSKAGKIIVTL